MAGASGFEPELKVLETRVLPLTPCPYVIRELVYHKEQLIANVFDVFCEKIIQK